VGACGSANDLSQAWVWFSDISERVPKIKNLELLALTSTGRLYSSFNLVDWVGIDRTNFAIGSGAEYALGALSAGKSPVKAVEIATDLDPGTGHGVTEYRL
jgi:ATP-dependent protease HslVU (ClpYQ) peptidase subunit